MLREHVFNIPGIREDPKVVPNSITALKKVSHNIEMITHL